MNIDSNMRETLFEMQRHDLAVHALTQRFEALPQRQALLKVRVKKRELLEKVERIDAAVSEARAREMRIRTEDETQAAKEERVQTEIEATRSDFRSVEARSKELAGIGRRRAALAEEHEASLEALHKAEEVKEHASAVLKQIEAQEAQLTEAFVREGTACKQGIAREQAQRGELARSIPEALLAVYEGIVKRTGGVALGELKGGSCGVCRAEINQGKLLAMKSQGNAALCPHCGRILFTEENEDER